MKTSIQCYGETISFFGTWRRCPAIVSCKRRMIGIWSVEHTIEYTHLTIGQNYNIDLFDIIELDSCSQDFSHFLWLFYSRIRLVKVEWWYVGNVVPKFKKKESTIPSLLYYHSKQLYWYNLKTQSYWGNNIKFHHLNN